VYELRAPQSQQSGPSSSIHSLAARQFTCYAVHLMICKRPWPMHSHCRLCISVSLELQAAAPSYFFNTEQSECRTSSFAENSGRFRDCRFGKSGAAWSRMA
jgi:hypothetical protein